MLILKIFLINEVLMMGDWIKIIWQADTSALSRKIIFQEICSVVKIVANVA